MYKRLILMIIYSISTFSQETVIKHYRPFSEIVNDEISKQAVLVVNQRKVGQCITQSKRIIREDAWRCNAGDKIFDPCFVNPKGPQNRLICPVSPWQGDSTEIFVVKPVDNKQHIKLDVSKVYPWAVELINGVTCVAYQPKYNINDLTVYYRCQDQSFLAGHLQRCKAQWTMLNIDKQQVSTTIAMTKAWF